MLIRMMQRLYLLRGMATQVRVGVLSYCAISLSLEICARYCGQGAGRMCEIIVAVNQTFI